MTFLINLLTSLTPSTVLLFLFSILAVQYLLYNLFFSPLSRIPGPLLSHLTPLWLYYHAWRGDEASQTARLHHRYGPIVRLAPNEIDIADGAALHPIYTAKGGFLKHVCYTNFYIEEVQTIFAGLDPLHRKARVKAIQPMFATGAVYSKAGLEVIHEGARRFCERVREAVKASQDGKQEGTVDALDLARRFSIDGLTTYLFGTSYAGFEEDDPELSLSRFVDYFVGFGRFFYVPAWIFGWLFWMSEKIWFDEATGRSLVKGDEYAHRIVSEAAKELGLDEGYAGISRPGIEGDNDDMVKPELSASADRSQTLQSRLLAAGFSAYETEQNIKCLMFAGTDSTSTNLAAICWNLARSPEIYTRLRREANECELTPGNVPADIQSLPYLRAVVNEGLRLSMANPTRLPRIVPPGGWEWGGYKIPPGTNVGVGAGQLHYNEEVFPGAKESQPERWLGADDVDDGRGKEQRERMHRDHVPFGVGARMCIARNLAIAELLVATWWVAKSGVLEGFAVRREDEERGGFEIKEWFNAHIVGGKVELVSAGGHTGRM